ncbi:hypothetical protein [Mycetocola saprophilus]|uniref:hypothetical protein n=1 Tax=Mycetocola saprophilus TaxID=76636 RepID=UPI0004BFC3EF|nr:hypothetical protein [Mycetocola saprophilus]
MSVLPSSAVSDVFAWSLEITCGTTSVVSIPLPMDTAAETSRSLPERFAPTSHLDNAAVRLHSPLAGS